MGVCYHSLHRRHTDISISGRVSRYQGISAMYSPTFLLTLFILTIDSVVCIQCPHPDFLSTSICDQCRNWRQAVRFAKDAGLTGVVTVMGPPAETFPPLFRPTGPYDSDLCLNRQPRPAYRCNMDSKRPYCFKLGQDCYIWHSPVTGLPHTRLRLALVNCVDDYTWSRQHQQDDYETNRHMDNRFDS